MSVFEAAENYGSTLTLRCRLQVIETSQKQNDIINPSRSCLYAFGAEVSVQAQVKRVFVVT
jgi:hypothetical protein